MKSHASSPLSVSVVIPVASGGEHVKICLRRIVRAVPSPDETIIVADGEQDESWRDQAPPGSVVLRIPVRGGPARARNMGAHAASGSVLLFLDADVAMRPDTIARVRAHFDNDPGLAAVFGSYDDTPGCANFLSQYKNLVHHFVHQTSSEDATTFWTGCGAVRRDAFLAMGGFDERLAWVEDIDLGYRLSQAGHRIRLDKALQVTHWKRWGAVSLIRSDVWHRAVPWTQLILRGSPFVNDLSLRTSSRLAVGLAYGLVGALIASVWSPFGLWLAAAQLLALLALDTSLLMFLLRARGPAFVLKAIPWRLVSWLYCGLGFAIGAATHAWTSSTPVWRRPVGERAQEPR